MAHSAALSAQRIVIRQRLLSSAIGLPIVLALVWFGGWVFVAGMLFAAMWGVWELFGMARRAGFHVSYLIGFGGTAGLLLVPAFVGEQAAGGGYLSVVVLVAGLLYLVYRSGRSENPLAESLLTVGGTYYLGLLFGYAVLLRDLPDGRGWLVLLFLATFAADTGAYVVGRKWGKHRLAPAVSPSKTREGAVGGLVAGIAVTLALTFLLPLPLTWWQALVIGFLITLAGQLGDLAESALKRGLQAKDAGVLIPGHGGILDRADSLLFAALMLYFAVRALEYLP